MKRNQLSPQEEAIILHKGTECPFSGKYLNNKTEGIYTCRQCDAPLYRSENKFDSHCGWPSFDDEIPGAIKRMLDVDGYRVEILCNHCGGHLGHIFEGEGLTPKNIRHCVNSISMNFIPKKESDISKAYFASGCFWGTEYHFMKCAGVIETTVGYMGGTIMNPTYKDVCSGYTGHVETVEVVYDSRIVDFEMLLRFFFETHNFEQKNGQGPDIGEQYQSVVFYVNEIQRAIVGTYLHILKNMGYSPTTKLIEASEFWEAEHYHQEYYLRNNGVPYCHVYKKLFF